MLDQLTINGRLIAAAMKLAAERPWREVTLRDIAQTAGVSLVDLRREFDSKGEVLAAFVRIVDDAVLARAPQRSGAQPRAMPVRGGHEPLRRAGRLQAGAEVDRRLLAGRSRAACARSRSRRRGCCAPPASAAKASRGRCAPPGSGGLRLRVPHLARRRRSGPRPHHGGARSPTAARRAYAASRSTSAVAKFCGFVVPLSRAHASPPVRPSAATALPTPPPAASA